MTTTRDATGRFFSTAGEPIVRLRLRLPRSLVHHFRDQAQQHGLTLARSLVAGLEAHAGGPAPTPASPPASPTRRRRRRAVSVDFYEDDLRRLRALAAHERLSLAEQIRTLVTAGLRARAEAPAGISIAELLDAIEALETRLDALGPSTFAAARLAAHLAARAGAHHDEDDLFAEAREAGRDEWEAVIDGLQHDGDGLAGEQREPAGTDPRRT